MERASYLSFALAVDVRPHDADGLSEQQTRNGGREHRYSLIFQQWAADLGGRLDPAPLRVGAECSPSLRTVVFGLEAGKVCEAPIFSRRLKDAEQFDAVLRQ